MEQWLLRGLLWLCCTLGCAPLMAQTVAAAPACPGPTLAFQPLADGLWLLPAAGEQADAGNRGQVTNLLLARHQGRLWLLGSGPSPAFGRALACQARQQLGLAVAEVAIPRARAELALGAAGLPGARLWATPAVRAAMQRQCPVCVERLRQQLGTAAADLGAAPVRMPRQMLRGSQGRWGPFEWRQISVAPGQVSTLWRHRGADVQLGHGLLWFGAPPEARDAEIARLEQATAALLAAGGEGTRYVGEQGPVAGRAELLQLLDYWQWLQHAAADGVARGDVQAAAPLPAIAGWAAHPRHGLNWQRALRQAEDAFLGAAPPR